MNERRQGVVRQDHQLALVGEPMYQVLDGSRSGRTPAPRSCSALEQLAWNWRRRLCQYADPDAAPLPGLEDKLDVVVNEYGNATVVTQRLNFSLGPQLTRCRRVRRSQHARHGGRHLHGCDLL